MSTEPTNTVQTVPAKTLLKATATALASAVAILITIVLPAEYGVDPTGIGTLLGLKSMAVTADGHTRASSVTRTETGPFKRNSTKLFLFPKESFEYKFLLNRGSTLVYSWNVEGAPLEYDFHGEPKDAPAGEFLSYEKKARAAESHGSLVAPFTGRHGWYFKNAGDSLITIRLQTAGYYEVAGIVSGHAVVAEQKELP